MDYFVDFTAAEFGDGLSHVHAPSNGAPGAWNTLVGWETQLYNLLADGDRVWIRRTGTGVTGNALLLQYSDKKVAWIGWPSSSDEYYDVRPGTGGPSPDPRTDWDPDTSTYTHADMTLLFYGSNQRFHRLRVAGGVISDFTISNTDFANCVFEDLFELPGDEPFGQTPTGILCRFCEFTSSSLVYMTDSRDISFIFCSFKREGTGNSLDAYRSHGITFFGCASTFTALPFFFDECGAVSILGSNLPGITLDNCSMVHMANCATQGSHTYGVNLVNCTGPVALNDSVLNGSAADLRVQGQGGAINCRHLELYHDVVQFSPASSNWLPNAFPMLNISEYGGDPTDYRAWQWGGQIRADTTVYRHGSYPISYRLEPSTIPPMNCPRLVLNMWGLEMTYMDQEPLSYHIVAIHCLHDGWPASTLHQGTIWGQADVGDMDYDVFGLAGRRLCFPGRYTSNVAYQREDLEPDPNSTWENQGTMTPFVVYVPMVAQHNDPVNLRVPIRLILAASNGSGVIYVDPVPRMAG